MFPTGRRDFLRILACGAMAWTLPGCSPEFDWRELHSEEGRFRVLMPGRWSQASGPAPGGATLMLWTVQTRSALFATGYADFADGAGVHLQAMIDGLGRNIRGSLGADREDHVAGIAGRAVLIDGAAPDGSPRQVHGRFYAWGLRLYQLTVISKPDAVPDLDLETFFRSFAPY